jgi:hypothetical protein
MSRRETFAQQSNGIAQNGRVDHHPGYLDSSQRISSLIVYLISSIVSPEQKSYYQGSPDVAPFPPSVTGGPKSGQLNPNIRSQYPNSYHTNSNTSPQPNNHSWDRSPPHFNSQQGPNRYPSNSHLVNGNLSEQSQNAGPSPQHRRQSQPPRPQVRLPSIPSSGPNHKIQQSPQINNISDLKPRQSPQSTHVKSAPVSSRRHRHSNSNSSKASTGSTGWSSTVKQSTQSSSSSSSTPSWEPTPQPPVRPIAPQSPIERDFNAESEWLLLRTETFNQPLPPPRDKYAHVHPLVRKYAGLTVPEVKPGEPRIANAVMSRRWQKEETLERDKREFQRKREEGIVEDRPATCFTEQQARASRLAMETLEILRTEFGEETNKKEDDKCEDIDKRDD